MKATLTSLVALCFSLAVFSSEPQVKNLIFEGAGIRGIAYAGVVAELEKQSIMQHVEKVGGTSAGAIVATLVALDYNSNEIARIISSTKMHKFNDGKYMFVGGIHRVSKRYGWYQGVKFSNWIGTLIAAKTGNSEITFAELDAYGCKELYLTATCLNQQKLVVLSRHNYPNMKVRDAVRISISIPLYFEAVFVDKNGGTFRKPSKQKQLDIMMDGGIVGNFPIHIFDHTDRIDTCTNAPRPNNHTLGIRIDSRAQIQQDQLQPQLIQQRVSDLGDYISAFYILIIEQLNRPQLSEQDWERTISVSSEGIGPRIRKLSDEQQTKLIESGKKSTEAFFSSK